jgi:diguanylate cyclase (GGDEF)-like protein
MSDIPHHPAGNVRLSMQRLPILLLSKIFVVLVCLSLLAVDAFQTWNAYEVRLKETQMLAANLTRSLTQHAEDTIKEADTVLSGLVERVEVDGTGQANLKRLRGLLMMQVVELPKLHGLFLYDKNGRWLVNSQQTRITGANNSDREYFIYHRNHPDRTPYIGKPIRSRSTGEWILTVSRRVNNADGSFAGVMLATLHMSYFRKFYDTLNIGDEGAILLAHVDGDMLVHRPFWEEKIGKSLKDSMLFREHLPKKSSGTYDSNKTVIDNLDRMVSYRRVEQYPLVVALALSKNDVFRSWWLDAAKHFMVTVLLSLVLGVLGARLTWQIGQRLHIENDLLQAQNKLEALNLELSEMAMQDGLTGLANRRRFDIALNEEFQRAMRNNLWLALIMIDVDSFKQFNDNFGHPEGDQCLKNIAQAVKACLNRTEDLPARYGGEEFAVLLPGADLVGAVAVAERIRLAIHNLDVTHPGSPVGVVTVSCGVDAILPLRNQNIPQDLIRGADKMLYIAKSSGRDHVVSPLSLPA